ncbi:hypothetical protein EZV62_024972 [Acer yangbiense]|uniref:Aquaporin n=1 Tax=Acer yangbiense TaxID=1000413 RepID=A0A5C7GX87_9ROSI|nr:hypothetical protein EZV62_024972 [Acer yangbiense]
MGVIKAAIGDALLTSMWEFSVPFLKVFTIIISTFLGIQTIPLLALFISTTFNTILVLTFSIIANLLGGASFNPSATLSLYAASLKPDASLISMAIRFPAQVAGGVGGVKAIMQFMPTQYKHMFKWPSLKVDLHTGAGVEGILTFLRSFALLVIMLRGPKSLFLKVWLVGVVTVGLVIAGSKYTGACMNPAKAFGWAYLNNWHNTWEFFYVYWVSPLTGAVLASWVFKYFLSASSSAVKQMKA